jgi:uncharacterized YccA/Bax inhibitor family protein
MTGRSSRTSNPVLKNYESTGSTGFAYGEGVDAYAKASAAGSGGIPGAPALPQPGAGGPITIADVMVKSLLVFAVTVVFAVAGWNLTGPYPWLLWVGMLGGLALGLVNAFKKVPSPALIMLYAAFQGVFLGGISSWYNDFAVQQQYQGIVLQAVLATMTTFGVMLTLYLTGVVKVTRKFQSIMMVALVSYMILGVASFVAALFGVGGGWGFYGVSGIGLAVCVIGVLIAAFFLLMDFEAISQGVRAGVPERESWRMAFGLLVTLIWLYLEFLRLLAIFSRN